jgi:uncharacterized protein YqhQ
VLFVGVFILGPTTLFAWVGSRFGDGVGVLVAEGVFRVALFVGYLWLIGRFKDVQRVFQYHGAEHKVIHAYEACGRPDAKRAEDYPPMHPRCGTGFLLVVMVVAIFVFAAVGKPPLLWLVVSRIVGIPVIVGISYEVGIKWLGKHPDGVVARVLLWPGLQLQRLTTRQPSADQLEVAAVALEEVIKKDEERVLELKEAAAQV